MKKHTETSGILAAVLMILKVWENSGKIIHHDRQNSGTIFIPPYQGRPGRKVKLCRDGTPDAYCILKDGSTIHIETKAPGKELTAKQQEFKDKIEKAPGHIYRIVRKIDDLLLILRERREGR